MQVNIGGVPVYIGMPVYGRIPPHTAISLAQTAHACGARGLPVEIGMEVRGIVTWARDAVVNSFLKSDKQKLFWIDSDMVWSTDAFIRMVALSTARDVVCAAYRTKKDDVEFQIAGSGQAQAADDLGLLEIWGAGLGFTIMDRKVVEAVAANAPMVGDAQAGPSKAVFRTDIWQGVRRGEDIAFFSDIRDAGFKVWLDPTIELGHVGDKCWRGRAVDSFQRSE